MAGNPFQTGLGILGAGLMGAAGQGDAAQAAVQGIMDRRQADDMQGALAQFQQRAGSIGAGPAVKEVLQSNPSLALDPQFQSLAKMLHEQGQGPPIDANVAKLNAAGIAPGTPEARAALFPEQQAPTSVREAEAMGFDLATADGRSQYAFFKRSQSQPSGGTTIVNQLGPEAKANPWTERGMKRVDELDSELAQAQSMLPEFREARAAIESGALTGLDAPAVGFNTPWGVVGVDVQPEIVSGLRVLSAIGIVDEGVMAQTERLQQIQNRLAPLVRPPGSGSTSDFEAQMYIQAVPGLMTTREGNLLLVEAYERLVQRKRQEMAVLEGMIEEGSYSPAKYFDRVNQLGKVFDRTMRETLERAAEPQAAPSQVQVPASAPASINLSTGEGLPGLAPSIQNRLPGLGRR